MPTVLVPPPYRGPTQGAATVEVAAGSVRACLEAVGQKHPGFLAQVLDERGEVHRFVRLVCNAEPLVEDGLERQLEPGDELEVVAAVGGG